METIIAAVLGFAALVIAVRTIWTKAVMPIAKAVKVLHATYDSVQNQDTRLRTVEKRSEELLNNSGSSLRDAVDRIELVQTGQSKMFADHLDWAQAEILKVWQNLASRDAVEAAARTAEMLEDNEKERGV